GGSGEDSSQRATPDRTSCDRTGIIADAHHLHRRRIPAYDVLPGEAGHYYEAPDGHTSFEDSGWRVNPCVKSQGLHGNREGSAAGAAERSRGGRASSAQG